MKPTAVLTKDQAMEIFRLSLVQSSPKKRPTATSVSRAFSVSEKTVRDIWCGRTWHEETLPLDPNRSPRAARKIGRPIGRKDSGPRRPKNVTGKTKIQKKIANSISEGESKDPESLHASQREMHDHPLEMRFCTENDLKQKGASDIMVHPMPCIPSYALAGRLPSADPRTFVSSNALYNLHNDTNLSPFCQGLENQARKICGQADAWRDSQAQPISSRPPQLLTRSHPRAPAAPAHAPSASWHLFSPPPPSLFARPELLPSPLMTPPQRPPPPPQPHPSPASAARLGGPSSFLPALSGQPPGVSSAGLIATLLALQPAAAASLLLYAAAAAAAASSNNPIPGWSPDAATATTSASPPATWSFPPRPSRRLLSEALDFNYNY